MYNFHYKDQFLIRYAGWTLKGYPNNSKVLDTLLLVMEDVPLISVYPNIAYLISVCFQLFGGLLIALESLPVWISWLKFLSFIRYAMEVHITRVSLNIIGHYRVLVCREQCSNGQGRGNA